MYLQTTFGILDGSNACESRFERLIQSYCNVNGRERETFTIACNCTKTLDLKFILRQGSIYDFAYATHCLTWSTCYELPKFLVKFKHIARLYQPEINPNGYTNDADNVAAFFTDDDNVAYDLHAAICAMSSGGGEENGDDDPHIPDFNKKVREIIYAILDDKDVETFNPSFCDKKTFTKEGPVIEHPANMVPAEIKRRRDDKLLNIMVKPMANNIVIVDTNYYGIPIESQGFMGFRDAAGAVMQLLLDEGYRREDE